MADYAHPEMLIDTAWLAAHLNDPNLRIVDCDLRETYRRAHIPGAICPRDQLYKNPDSRVFVMEPAQFQESMSEMGIGDDTEVIAYDTNGTLWAGRFWWCLNYFGHPRVRVLNGGFNKWLQEGRPITMAEAKVAPARFTPHPDESQRATAEYIMEAMSRPDVVILDVRSDGEWDGTATRGNKRSGHIPGAVHLEWTNNITEGDVRCIKPADELRSMLDAAGVTPEKEVITV